MKIYGNPISGNCLKVKWTADRLGLKYDWVEINAAAGETRTPAFLSLNPAGQIPVLELDDGTVLTQSNAIILYLSKEHDGGLVPADSLAYARVLQWMFWEQYSHEPYIAVRRRLKLVLGKRDDEMDPVLLEKGEAALAQMQQHLETRDYLVGDSLTAADVSLLAYTRVAPDGGFDLSRFPAVERWIARVEADLNLPASKEVH